MITLNDGSGVAFPDWTSQNHGFGDGTALECYRGAERAMPCPGHRAGAPV